MSLKIVAFVYVGDEYSFLEESTFNGCINLSFGDTVCL